MEEIYLKVKRSAESEESIAHSRGSRKYTSERSTLAFETQGRRHQSKTGLSVAPQKGLVFSKNVFKNLYHYTIELLYCVSSFARGQRNSREM